jgi:hypothetical protein
MTVHPKEPEGLGATLFRALPKIVVLCRSPDGGLICLCGESEKTRVKDVDFLQPEGH